MFKIGDSICTIGGTALQYTPPLPPMPVRCLRVRTNGNEPVLSKSNWTYSAVPGHADVYDVVSTSLYGGWNANQLLEGNSNVVEWIDANLSGAESDQNISGLMNTFDGCSTLEKVRPMDLSLITSAAATFEGCSNLTSVGALNLQSARDISYMFQACTALPTLPNLTAANAVNTDGLFLYCYSVTGGILDMYSYLSGRSTSHNYTFRYCGQNTPQGAAELAQIPDDWK